MPADTISAGFDNVADVQSFSATLMEGYLRAASRISSLAVGDPRTGAAETTVKVPRTASQMRHVEGAPFGTRGGISVLHTFPADGEYSFRMQLHSIPTGQLFGSTVKGELIEVSIDGDRVAVLEINPRMSEADPNGMNIVTPRGQNQYKGSIGYSFQPLDWNGDNTKGGAAPGGLPTFQSVNQWDGSLGGRIVRDRIWFFGTYRYADLENGISRTPLDLSYLKAFKPDFEAFNNSSISKQPFVKLTAQLAAGHELSGFFQNDRNRYTSSRERNTQQINYNSAGGSMYQAKLNSVWGDRLMTQLSGSFNNKGGSDIDTYSIATGVGPQVLVHQLTTLSGGVPSGNGALVTMDNVQSRSLSPSSMIVLRGDLTYYRTGWAGSHEFKTGIWAAPRLRRDVTNMLVNDGYILNEVRQIDPTSPSAGTVSFHRRYEGPLETMTTDARDRDIGIYVQDSWKPNARLTANVGVRADFVRRFDNVYGVERMKSVNVGPRFGIAYLVTEDARNVLRASAVAGTGS